MPMTGGALTVILALGAIVAAEADKKRKENEKKKK